MGCRGPGALPQTEKREQFARLIAQGYNNSEACRIVGINRRTGKRWRHGRAITTRDGRKLHYPPVIVTGAGRRVSEISDRYLSEDERVRIADLHRGGAGVRDIAGKLGRSPSTVSRELRRNRDPVSGQYRPHAAHKLAVQRRARPRAGKIARDEVLRQFVAGRLEKRWSPEQISQALRGQFRASRHGMSCMRRSTRRSTALNWAVCLASCQRGRCAPGGAAAGRTAGLVSAGRTGSPP